MNAALINIHVEILSYGANQETEARRPYASDQTIACLERHRTRNPIRCGPHPVRRWPALPLTRWSGDDFGGLRGRSLAEAKPIACEQSA